MTTRMSSTQVMQGSVPTTSANENNDKASDSHHQVLLIGLSGPSSCGKTTLARLLRQVFNTSGNGDSGLQLRLFIIHADDFYKSDKDIPRATFSSTEFGTRELDDWDCVGSLDLPLARRVLRHVKERQGELPEDFASKEDKNSVGESGVGEDEVKKVQDEVKAWIQTQGDGDGRAQKVTICILDGFLLYVDPLSKPESLEKELDEILAPLLDLKLFLPGTRENTIERRTKRIGYVTLEGFWEDPPGYVQDVVWPNYARDHAWLFGARGTPSEEVARAIDDGKVNRQIAEENGIFVAPGNGDSHLRELLPWAVERLKVSVRQLLR